MSSFEQVEILLAEDNPHDAEMTMRALRKINFANKMHWAKDGQEALDFLFGTPPQSPKLVMLDIKMPKVDGIEVLRRIKSDERTRAIPVVVMTSSNEERDVLDSYRLGVNSYIVKPIAFDEFLQRVGDVGQYWTLHNTPPS